MKQRGPRGGFFGVIATCVSLAAALSPSPGAGLPSEQVWITEFMAVNTTGLVDRDREHSDWIELHNPGSAPVDLQGWHLTDKRSDLTKWRFPSTVLGPGEFLIVFASKKDRRLAGAELHTNFKLDSQGSYLALVKPDGVTVASEFAPSYPPQVPNVSFGPDMTGRVVPLIGPASPYRWHVPARDLGKAWAAPEFNDSAWILGTNTLQMEHESLNSPGAPGSLRAQMLGRNASVYLRIPFQVADTSLDTFKLRLNYQDGVVVWLNGREIVRRNAPEAAHWNSAATTSRPTETAATLAEAFDGPSTNFVTGQLDATTLPRITRLAENNPSGYLRLVNGRQTNQVNSISFPAATPAPFETMQADFDFRWRGSGEGTERLVFLLIPVTAYGPRGNGVDLISFRESKDPKFAGVLAVQLLHNMENGQKAMTVHWDRNRRTTVSLPQQSLGPRVFHHVQIRLRFTQDAAVLDVQLQSRDKGDQLETIPAISQLTVPGLKPFAARVQFAGRIGNWDQTIDLDNLLVRCVPVRLGASEEFELTRSLVRPGGNLLALQGLSRSADDPSFSLQAGLVGQRTGFDAKDLSYFPVPTPRAANRDGLSGLAPTPVFSIRGGVFTNAVRVQLSASAGTIRFTLDGSEPTVTSQAYSEPISIQASTRVRAKCFVTGLLPSRSTTETFTILEENAGRFSSNLPLLILNPFGQYISSGRRSDIAVRLIDTTQGRSSLTGKADFDGRGSVNVRGFSTLRQPKNSLTLRLIDENGDKIKAPLLGLPKESDWVLYAPYSDKTLMRDVLAYELSNQMGRYAPRTRFVEVFIDRSGGKLNTSRDYMGVYVLIEKIKLGKNRVNITELFGSENAEPQITGGYLFKRDHSENWEAGFHTSHGNHFYYVDPKPPALSREQMSWLTRYMNRFEQALYGPDFRDPVKGYAAYLDVASFIDQHWLIETSKNIDGFRYSAFLHKDRNGKLQMGPAWDWNLSFGNADYHDGSDPTGWYTPLLRESEISWFRRLGDDPDFEQRTIDRWGELARTVFAPDRLLKRVDELAAQLDEAQARNFRRWPVLGRRVNPNDFVGNTYAEEIHWMKQWMQRRVAWIQNQFLSPPAVTRNAETAKSGPTVALKAASGKIYYTTDGSDPRLPGGNVSPKALPYSAPVVLKPGAKLMARAHQRNNWSPLTAASLSASERAQR